jgi:UDP-N-acetyl-2-amino-2-deoxyglucuronate dehydrogenase
MKFAIIGFGYIAQRHLKAIKELGHEVTAVYDPHNSAGILDSYFPNAKFFTLFEDFDIFCGRNLPDYVTVLSPNYLHKSHVTWATDRDIPVICEKPLFISSHDLLEFENHKIYPILQLRYHPSFTRLQSQAFENPKVTIDYFTYRGDWYSKSWKADENKSGGLLFNIGIHLFDIVTKIFGPVEFVAGCKGSQFAEIGTLRFHNGGEASYCLSIDERVPNRVFSVDGVSYEFDSGFTELHTQCYREILAGRGFDFHECYDAIRLIERIKIRRRV